MAPLRPTAGVEHTIVVICDVMVRTSTEEAMAMPACRRYGWFDMYDKDQDGGNSSPPRPSQWPQQQSLLPGPNIFALGQLKGAGTDLD